MVKEQSLSSLIKTADKLFSELVRKEDAHNGYSGKDGYINCPICQANVHWKQADAAHVRARACRLRFRGYAIFQKRVKQNNDAMNTQQKEVCKRAIEIFGLPAQYDMIVEECAELTKAILKYKRNPCAQTFENVCEELADVEIMLYQGRKMFDGNIVSAHRDQKIERLKMRLAARKIRRDDRSIDRAMTRIFCFIGAFILAVVTCLSLALWRLLQ